MITNRQQRRKVISQARKGTITKVSASYRTISALKMQESAFQETVVLFKAVVAAYFERPFPDALWNQLAEQIEKKRGAGATVTWADLEKMIQEEVVTFKASQGE